jgi:hypothetical protein
MATQEKIRHMLDTLPIGSEITVTLNDGTRVAGPLQSRDGDRVLIGDESGVVGHDAAPTHLQLGDVETVSMKIGSLGPE